MEYKNCYPAIFRSRPNRFIAMVEIDGREEKVHVKNTGRCAELLQAGNRVYLEKSDQPARKTAYDLVAVEKKTANGTKLVNMDSMAPNRMAQEWIEAGSLGNICDLRSEVTIGDSRFDFAGRQADKRVVIEVKGCTLEENGVARFPDAPTQRGLKHVQGLTKLTALGCRCIILIVIQMKGVAVFRPNWDTYPEFGDALKEAYAAGVEIVAVDSIVDTGSARIDAQVAVDLEKRF